MTLGIKARFEHIHDAADCATPSTIRSYGKRG